MNTMFSLIKTSLNVNFSISALKYRFTVEKKRWWEPILIGISVIIGGGSLLVMFTFLMLAIFMAGKSSGRPDILLESAFFATQFMIFLFGIIYIISIFYFSRDLGILIPLPLTPAQVLGGKLAVVMVNEYLTALPILLPALIIYGAGTGQGLFYWLKSLVLFIIVPGIPLVFVAFIVLLLMRFVNIKRSRDLFTVMGSLLAIVFGIGINFFSQTMSGNMKNSNPDNYINNIFSAQIGFIDSITAKFPPAVWASKALAVPGMEGLLYLLLFIAVSVAFFIVLAWLGNRVFYKSLLSGQEVRRKRKMLSTVEMEKSAGIVASPVAAVFKREWKSFMRTPIFVMNGMAGMIIMPIVVMMPLIANKAASGFFLKYLQDPAYTMYVTLGCIALIIFSTSVNIVASTSISREGRTFWISKMVPVSPKDQISGKVAHAISISAIGIAVGAIPLAAVIGLSPLRLAVVIIIGLAGSALMCVLSMFVDVIRPRLDWETPQQAVKQNMNGLFGMLITMAGMSIAALITIAFILAGLPEGLVYAALLVLLAGSAWPALKGLQAFAEYRYAGIEV